MRKKSSLGLLDSSTKRKVVLGAAGVAIAAGAIAAGAALANKKTRTKLGKTAKKAIGTAQNIATKYQGQQYPFVGHQLSKKPISKGSAKNR